MQLVGPFSSGVAAGSAGSATNNFDTLTRLTGRVIGIYVKYQDSPPNTTDVVIGTKGTAPAVPTTNLLTLTNKNADGWFYPRVTPTDTSGVALAALTTAEPQIIDDVVNISIAGANAADYVDVWFMLD